MNRFSLLFICVLGLRFSTADGASPQWTWQSALVPDVGFDLDAAEVLHVTNLNAEGKGSLRDALWKKGPRLIVFDVGGVIDLKMREISISEPQVYVAGQTAPPPGITLIRGGVSVSADQTVIQHLAVRPGDAEQAAGSGWEPDGISTRGGPHDVWIDHCSCTWSVDENLSASTYKPPNGVPASRIYFRDCIVAEALNAASHKKGPHSKGTLVFGGTQEVAIVGCLYSSNYERNPLFQPGTSGVIVNNLIANPGQRAMHGGVPEPENGASNALAKIAIVGNTVWMGQKTKRSGHAIFEGKADAFFKGNEGRDWFGEPMELMRTPFEPLAAPPVWPAGLEAMANDIAIHHISRFVGARPAQRDAIDQRIVAQALSGTARIIDSQDQVGGYPSHPPTEKAVAVPDKDRSAWLESLARAVTFGD